MLVSQPLSRSVFQAVRLAREALNRRRERQPIPSGVCTRTGKEKKEQRARRRRAVLCIFIGTLRPPLLATVSKRQNRLPAIAGTCRLKWQDDSTDRVLLEISPITRCSIKGRPRRRPGIARAPAFDARINGSTCLLTSDGFAYL